MASVIPEKPPIYLGELLNISINILVNLFSTTSLASAFFSPFANRPIFIANSILLLPISFSFSVVISPIFLHDAKSFFHHYF